MTHSFRVLVIGGTGHFGGRICHRLVHEPGVQLLVAGRGRDRALAFAKLLQPEPEVVKLDRNEARLSGLLGSHRVDLVIDASGPFQGYDYRVARACINVGSHYIDLADCRHFVSGFASALTERALERDVLLVSGASSVPGVSSAVVDVLRPEFERIDAICISIAPANRIPRGLSVVAAVLSYCGRPFLVLENGRWKQVYGWQDMRRVQYPFGARWAAACDVPDLELFPHYYAAQTVSFHAALELSVMQWGLWLASWLARWGLVVDWSRYAKLFKAVGNRLDAFGTDIGGMHVEVKGSNQQGQQKRLRWRLTARQGHGPEIPCLPAVILARKLMRGDFKLRGAHACVGLISLAELKEALGDLDISWTTVAN